MHFNFATEQIDVRLTAFHAIYLQFEISVTALEIRAA
jgi:hypothetical protein